MSKNTIVGCFFHSVPVSVQNMANVPLGVLICQLGSLLVTNVVNEDPGEER